VLEKRNAEADEWWVGLYRIGLMQFPRFWPRSMAGSVSSPRRPNLENRWRNPATKASSSWQEASATPAEQLSIAISRFVINGKKKHLWVISWKASKTRHCGKSEWRKYWHKVYSFFFLALFQFMREYEARWMNESSWWPDAMCVTMSNKSECAGIGQNATALVSVQRKKNHFSKTWHSAEIEHDIMQSENAMHFPGRRTRPEGGSRGSFKKHLQRPMAAREQHSIEMFVSKQYDWGTYDTRRYEKWR
jgi:hypothetical protein